MEGERNHIRSRLSAGEKFNSLLVALIGALSAIRADPPREERPKLDWVGFLSLSMAVACIQLMLDRGERAEWFGSTAIVVACALAILFGWIFFVHSLTKEHPFIACCSSAILRWESAYLPFSACCS